jgi:hypothetical protein
MAKKLATKRAQPGVGDAWDVLSGVDNLIAWGCGQRQSRLWLESGGYLSLSHDLQ